MGLGSLGISELVVIFIIVLVFFGPRRFPEIARSMGSAMREFRRSLNQIQRELEEVDPRKDIPGKELLDEMRSGKEFLNDIRTGKPGAWLDPNKPRSRPFDTPGSRSAPETPGPQQTGEAAGASARSTETPPTPEAPHTPVEEADSGEQLPMFEAEEPAEGQPRPADAARDEGPTDDSRPG
jgi:sec-independent protein translocase protein TatA